MTTTTDASRFQEITVRTCATIAHVRVCSVDKIVVGISEKREGTYTSVWRDLGGCLQNDGCTTERLYQRHILQDQKSELNFLLSNRMLNRFSLLLEPKICC